ncbi:MAG: response regulator [Acetobacteraceae bacterium]|nr:response regulator [Acetobacteraceae bacterium]
MTEPAARATLLPFPAAASPPTILVIDDDPDVAGAVAGACAREGASVATASDGRHVRFLLEAAAPDGIILDIGLPGRDGLELLRDVADLAPRTAVLVMSGRDQAWLTLSETMGELLGALRVASAQKPIRLETLKTFVAGLRSHVT